MDAHSLGGCCNDLHDYRLVTPCNINRSRICECIPRIQNLERITGMLTTLEFENFGTIEKFSMTVGSEFKRFTVLGGMPDIIEELRLYFIKNPPNWIEFHRDALEYDVHHTQYAIWFTKILQHAMYNSIPNVFAHTQSYEMLEAIVEALKDDKDAQDNFAYVRLDRVLSNQGHIEAVSYSYELLSKAIKRKLEVR